MKKDLVSLFCLAVSCLTGFVVLIGFISAHSPMPPVAAQTCTFTLNPTSQSFQAGGGSGSVAVTASGAACGWTATSNAPWLTITSGTPGTGNGTLGYSVATNSTTAQHTGTLTIAGQTFNVTQAAGLSGLQFFPLAH